ncbi:MAG: flavin binding monooxygenase [Frankiales bacterium]|nr:flavin binding monooxygenase [Frankiales bacterium]
MTAPAADHVDVLIVGAGLSGVGAAHHLTTSRPGTTFTLLEARGAMGGTWDLFRYPGVRSDSDMHTLGYRFRPWTEAKAIADGPAILQYVQETAREAGIDRKVRYHHKVVRADWSSSDARWTVTAERTDTGETVVFTCSFLFCASGYYRYDQGFTPDFAGVQDYAGTLVHPQLWPEDLDVTGKKVVVIGSGATAVTLVPALAKDAAHVTMLQRSPSYVLPVPDVDPIADALRRLPDAVAYPVIRWKNVAMSALTYKLSRKYPAKMRSFIRWATVKQLPEGYEVDTHFKPVYQPWDQRMCMVPNGDLFAAISRGDASVVTDHVETFTEQGLRLRSGQELEADVVVTATGLNLLAFGGLQLAVDGEDVDIRTTMAYKSLMLTGVPNFAYALGYTNASWTLKADLTSEYVCRLLAHMEATGTTTVVPERDPSVQEEPFLDFQAGYVVRAIEDFPKQGSAAPWKVTMNYVKDLRMLRHGSLVDGVRFSRPTPAEQRTSVSA